MGLFKKVKKVVKKVGGIALKPAKTVIGMVGGKDKERDSGEADLGTRAAAAKRLVNTQKQAGSGQISYNTMEEEQT